MGTISLIEIETPTQYATQVQGSFTIHGGYIPKKSQPRS